MGRNLHKSLENILFTVPSSKGSFSNSLPIEGFFSFANKILLEHGHVHSFPYCLFAVTVQQQSGIVATETLWLGKPNMFTVWSFTKNSASHGFYCC